MSVEPCEQGIDSIGADQGFAKTPDCRLVGRVIAIVEPKKTPKAAPVQELELRLRVLQAVERLQDQRLVNHHCRRSTAKPRPARAGISRNRSGRSTSPADPLPLTAPHTAHPHRKVTLHRHMHIHRSARWNHNPSLKAPGFSGCPIVPLGVADMLRDGLVVSDHFVGKAHRRSFRHAMHKTCQSGLVEHNVWE